jgi:glucose/arabinose dehydrogenase
MKRLLPAIRFSVFFLVFLTIASFTGNAEIVKTEKLEIKIETVADGLQNPWATTMLPDGRLLITEKPGRLRIVENGKLLAEPVSGIPPVMAIGQGGLLDVELHPDFASNGWIYLAHSKSLARNGQTTIIRGRLRGNEFTDVETVFDPPTDQAPSGPNHWGCRIRFDKAGYLFFGLGDRGDKTTPDNHAQDLSNIMGKIHRIHDDGRIPADNPYVGRNDVPHSIWCHGNRNPQGLVVHPETGELWETEHGPRGGDELNIIRKGLNYGWPIATYGINYSGKPITDTPEKEGMEPPIYHWTPSIGICGMDIVRGDHFPAWKNNFLVTGLSGGYVGRLEMAGNKVLSEEKLLKGKGRMRDVRVLRDGLIYVTVDGPGQVLKISPAE